MKRLLLAGGGQAHVFVLRALANWKVEIDATLVTPSDRLIYTGMLPGWIAGHYPLPSLTIPLAPLLQAANVRLVTARIASLDLQRRIAFTDRDEAIEFDLLSIATGPAPNYDAIEGAREHALPLRPLERFVTQWQRIELRAQSAPQPFRITVVGSGAGGVEVAFAARYRMPNAHVQLVTGAAPILPGHSMRARSLALAMLHRCGVELIDAEATHIECDNVTLSDGSVLPSDATLLMTGAAPDRWLRDTGLATDDAGFLAINSCLQSTSHEFVFAAGDAATMIDAKRPKSGVYAVRAGPRLAKNLLAKITAAPLQEWQPQRRALYLLSTGAKHAIASWGTLAFEGDWVWHWKNRIDRAYIAKFK
ncbi:MAG: FAD-dependent oxidoreductase [Burkholderiaceae bacterium]